MKTIVTGIVCLIAMVGSQAIAAADTASSLDWTVNATSVQAELYRALTAYKQTFQKPEDETPVSTNADELSVQDARAKISCRSQQMGLLTVQSYSCQLSSDTHWNPRSNSVAAVLYAGLELLLEAQDTAMPSVTQTGSTLQLEDNENRLRCFSRDKILGVNKKLYRCQLSRKNR